MKAVLFDLDGTLLPMDQDVFTGTYFKRLAAYMAPYGYDPKALIDAVWAGTYAMIKNDGSRSNEAAFWAYFTGMFGEKARADEPRFEAFYRTDFQEARAVCGQSPMARAVIDRLKEAGIRVALATNPLFPAIATESRIRWAGLAPEDFEFYTTYENCRYCKPNPKYYADILEWMGLAPGDCLMVGNDVGDDMVARELGMDVFLLTDCLINREGEDISQYPNGDFEALMAYLDVWTAKGRNGI